MFWEYHYMLHIVSIQLEPYEVTVRPEIAEELQATIDALNLEVVTVPQVWFSLSSLYAVSLQVDCTVWVQLYYETVSDDRLCLRRFSLVTPPRSFQGEVPQEPFSLRVPRHLEGEQVVSQPVPGGVVPWSPPQPNWNPWTSCNIDEGPMATVSGVSMHTVHYSILASN